MADDTAAKISSDMADVAEVPDVVLISSDAPAPAASSPPQNAEAPETSGKRAMSYLDADEGGGEPEDGLPPRKKAKTGLTQGDASEDDAVLESADEDDHEPESQVIADDVMDGADEDNADDEAASLDQAMPADEGSEDPEADIMDGTKSYSVNGEESASSPNESSQQAVTGLAVSNLRTSFGAAPHQGQAKADFAFKMHNPISADDRSQLDAALRSHWTHSLYNGSLEITKRDLQWKIGTIKPEYAVGHTWLEVWESIIDKWAEDFMSINQANVDAIGMVPSLLKSAFQKRLEQGPVNATPFPDMFRWIHKTQLKNPDSSRLKKFGTAFKSNPKQKAKKLLRRQAREAKKLAAAPGQVPTTSFTPINTGEPPNNAQHANAAPSIKDQTVTDLEEGSELDSEQGDADMEDGEINSADASGVDMQSDGNSPSISQTELDQRQLYFPGIPDDAIFCITCAHIGHTTDTCPELTCKFCQGAHFKYECPTRQRCGKCRQLGHTKTSCREKLAIAPGEAAVECTICEGDDHTEIDCIELCQLYRLEPGNVKQVNQLLIYCYTCGTAGHFGGDCPSADLSLPPTKTWTMTTASLYVDPSSENVSLTFQNPLPPPVGVMPPNIPGRSIVPQTHVVYEMEDDDGDGDLLAPPHKRAKGGNHNNQYNKKPPIRPTINIASNFTFGGAGPGPSGVLPPRPPPQQQQQKQSKKQSKKQKGPPLQQPPKKNKAPANNANNSNPNKRHKGGQKQAAAAPPMSFSALRTSQPPPPGQGGGGHGSGGGSGGANARGGAKRQRNRGKGGRGGGQGGGGRGGGGGGGLQVFD